VCVCVCVCIDLGSTLRGKIWPSLPLPLCSVYMCYANKNCQFVVLLAWALVSNNLPLSELDMLDDAIAL